MKPATKHTLLNLVKVLIAFTGFVLLSVYLPDGSWIKNLIAYGILTTLILVTITPIYNTIVSLINKFKKK